MSAVSSPLIPLGVVTQEFRTPSTVRRGIIAGVVGNMLEWYDFALFGFFAAQIGAHFFPATNPTASLLAAYGTFAAGFLMRPIGGAFFGWVGDKFGRKQALLWSVLAMALPSFAIGLLPSEATIGLAAPVLLLVFRLLQGLAVGGEYMASSVFLVEGAVPGKRGLMGAWSPFGCFAGTLLGSAAGLIVNSTLSPNEVMAYGWRVPFLFGLLVALGGIVIRRNFVEKVPHQPPAKSPLGESFRNHWRTILHLILLVAGLSVGFYTTFVYSATWLKQVAGVSAKTMFEINTIAMALSLGAVLLAGAVSDRFGRRPVVAVVSGLLMVVSYPLMSLMAGGQWIAVFVGQLILSLLVSAASGVLASTMAELAPWRVRCTVLSISYNFGVALLGGTTPLVAAWLVSRTGFTLAPAVYMAIAGGLSFIGAVMLPKTMPHRLTTEFQSVRSPNAVGHAAPTN
jgi:MHS family proline/betaine transporter-like MFS transporter